MSPPGAVSDPPASARVALAHAIDYAGLFPPAALSMAEAVTNYASYLSGPDAWALGRFVVPVARLHEFEASAAAVDAGGPLRCRLSALAGGDVRQDATRVRTFNHGHEGRLSIDTIEGRASTPEQVAELAESFAGLAVFVEVTPDDALPSLVDAVRRQGLRAKIRTGGVTRDSFPASREVARFIVGCVSAGVPFKATAGLHHAVRGDYPLTYSPDSVRGTMFGYLNLVVAATLAAEGEGEDAIAEVLERDDAASVAFEAHTLRWRTLQLSERSLARARHDVVLSFGSCSFREPIDELASLTGSR